MSGEVLNRSSALIFWCPGCQEHHFFDSRWEFNGDMVKPTFAPSLLTRFVKIPPRDPATDDFPRGEDGEYLKDASGRLAGAKDMVCHIFVRNGQIEYLGDCTHDMAGKTVPMVPDGEH
jgi:hypothetical protein